MRVFILEDDETRISSFLDALSRDVDVSVARDISEVDKVFVGEFDYVFLDHDLGGRAYVDQLDENTGSEFVRRYGDKLGGATIVIHSWNIDRALGMHEELSRKGYSVYQIPFGNTVLNIANTICAH